MRFVFPLHPDLISEARSAFVVGDPEKSLRDYTGQGLPSLPLSLESDPYCGSASGLLVL